MTVSADLRRWADGLDHLQIGGEAQTVWSQANDVFFDRTQSYAHVLTGAMKTSGRTDVRVEGQTIVGETEYGGGSVDYVLYELARGGDHDFLTRAYAATSGLFGKAVGDALQSAVLAAVRRG